MEYEKDLMARAQRFLALHMQPPTTGGSMHIDDIVAPVGHRGSAGIATLQENRERTRGMRKPMIEGAYLPLGFLLM